MSVDCVKNFCTSITKNAVRCNKKMKTYQQKMLKKYNKNYEKKMTTS